MLVHPSRFWNMLARTYARRPVQNQTAYQYKLDVTRQNLAPQDRILEFGCGTGTTALIHAANVAHIDAIDYSSEMISIAQSKAEEQGVRNVNFEICAFENWPVPEADQKYDAVLAMSILHLVSDLDETLDRVRKSLKEGGLFFSSTVCLEGFQRFAIPALGTIGVLPKIRALTQDILVERLQAHGFISEHTWRPEDGSASFIVARSKG
ncbi:class I SAM-dependent methyltransferase [Parasedimentitalea marina]|uniref:Class I SAM-dependent methyltransferase n=1 Tax=Parasedimentitalea marina TaxID=2483033 RepID=A0A3T0N2J3_9RHOB|nr:class I SAM-dependent methyltransferase [Parasedimentitalea marina]AZV78221.1 class I SAM-dependent methyltransferase [Parasedimentitalea marina]